MKRNVAFMLFCLLGSALAACQRVVDSDSSTIVIQTPESWDSLSSKSSGLAAFPTDRKACYGISVTGPNIPSTVSACSPKLGEVSGFVDGGKTLEVSVPKGSDRKFELYMFLKKAGEDTKPCPEIAKNISTIGLTDVYLVGSTSGVSIQEPTETVTIYASFPGLDKHIAQQLNFPTSCTVVQTPTLTPLPFAISTGSGIAEGTGVTMVGRLGRPLNDQILTGSSYRLKLKPNVQ